jgi:hypothetical protein
MFIIKAKANRVFILPVLQTKFYEPHSRHCTALDSTSARGILPHRLH